MSSSKNETEQNAITKEREHIREQDSKWPEYVLRAEMHVVDIWCQTQNLSSEEIKCVKAARLRYRGRKYTSRSRLSKKTLQKKNDLLQEQVSALEAGYKSLHKANKLLHDEITALKGKIAQLINIQTTTSHSNTNNCSDALF